MATAAAPDLRDRLRGTLGADDALDRELGAGGMARVFAAAEARTGRRVAVGVPAALAAVVTRLLAKDASARPASADELLRALGEAP